MFAVTSNLTAYFGEPQKISMNHEDDKSNNIAQQLHEQQQRNDNKHDKITLKAAVLSCWPNETEITVIRWIKDGWIDVQFVDESVSVSDGTSLSSIAPIGSSTRNQCNTLQWKTIRQYGKRLVRPNDYIRLHRGARTITPPTSTATKRNNTIDSTCSTSSDYDVRQVPQYPIVIAMYKPCGYVVTRRSINTTNCSSKTTKAVIDDSNYNNESKSENDRDCDDRSSSSSSTSSSSSEKEPIAIRKEPELSVYDLLETSMMLNTNANVNMNSAKKYNNHDASISLALQHLPSLRAVGRLDKNTEGLLLFTNHGRWNIALTTPFNDWSNRSSNHNSEPNAMTKDNNLHQGQFPRRNASSIVVWKRYRCHLQNPASDDDLQFWTRGNIPYRHQWKCNRSDTGIGTTGIAYSQPALSATYVTSTNDAKAHDNNDNKRIVDVVIGEGKYRQVRRCWESLHQNKVLHLQRLSFGPIELFPTTTMQQQQQQIQPGHCRLLSNIELQRLQQYVHNWYKYHPHYSDETP